MSHLIGAVVGGALGYLYYKKVGCVSGTCPLTATPWIIMIYGCIMGMLVMGL